METEICPVCHSKENKVTLSEVKDYITKHPFDLKTCSSCKNSFVSPVPKEMEVYYPFQYRRYGKLVSFVLKMFYSHRVKRWIKFKNEPGYVLEIGCGSGFMLNIFRQKGWQAKGIERSQNAAIYAKETLGLDVIHAGIETLPIMPTYDLIILFNVLEHLKDPLSMLKACTKRLNKNGKIIFSVPNIDSWQAHFGGSNWLHLDLPRHLFHFTPESLKEMLKIANLNIFNTSFISFEHDPYGWVETAISKIMRQQNILTSYLMGLKKINYKIFLSFCLFGVLLIPAILLSMISWVFKKGALIQIIANKES